jgi:uncharacterized membrane protein
VSQLATPSRDDPIVAGASRLAGGPMGRFGSSRPRRWLTPIRALLVLTTLTCVLGFIAKAPCRTHPWSDEYQYTRVCYTDVFALYYAEQLGAKVDSAGNTVGRISVPYRDHPVEYPAVIGGLMWVAGEFTNAVHPNQPADGVDTRDRTFFDITALMMAAFALLTTWALARLAGRQRIWDAAMFALAPTLFFHAYTNWDLAAVGLAMLGMYFWSRGPGYVPAAASGLLLGVAVATKLYPVLILLVIVVLCIRAAQVWHAVITAVGAVVGFCIAYAPAWLLSRNFAFPDAKCPGTHSVPAWEWFWRLNTDRVSDWDSLWFMAEHARGRPLDSNVACGQAPHVLNLGVAVATAVVVVAALLLAFFAPRRPRLPQIAFLVVAGFLLANKVDSPQYVLWLVPLAVLARPRWRMFLFWQATEVLLLFARFYFFVGNDAANANHAPQGIPIEWFFTAVAIRDATLVVLMGLVVWEVLKPEYDVVRRDGVDDPAGGVLDGAPGRGGRRTDPVPAPA